MLGYTQHQSVTYGQDWNSVTIIISEGSSFIGKQRCSAKMKQIKRSK